MKRAWHHMGVCGPDRDVDGVDFSHAAVGDLAGLGGLLARTVDGGTLSIRATFLHPVGGGRVNGLSE